MYSPIIPVSSSTRSVILDRTKFSVANKRRRSSEDSQTPQAKRFMNQIIGNKSKDQDWNKLKLNSEDAVEITSTKTVYGAKQHLHDEDHCISKDRSKKSKILFALYDVFGVLGQGGGGKVYKAVRKTDKQPVAIKQIMRKKVKHWEKVKGKNIPQEIALMLRIKEHQGIITLHEWFELKDSFIMILERPENCMDIWDYVQEVGWVTETTARMIFEQVVESNIHIHKCGVVHRDLKSENIVLDFNTGDAKLIDFGCGTLLHEDRYKHFSGTPLFYPPEWYNEGYYYASSSATWSLGVLLYEMLCGDIPFKSKEEISKADVKFMVSWSREAKHLISWMLSCDPDSRPSLEDILGHPWMNTK
ncbi:serine/threonine-protein kinase pim-1-like [Clavelina lepadiformis]|uniref:serine/threonine-protein kinase pim-1-like n=1 Tax=Clavelina lepadiformis TaxID=159417 RepID=UPI0040435402